MKTIKNRKVIYIILSIAVLLVSVMPVVFSKDASLTSYSAISIAFAVCSVIYAFIAFAFKNKGNLFVVGKYWFYRVLSLSFSENKAYTETEDYKKEFELSAFIFCVSIPIYISFAFFANGFYSALLKALRLTIFRQVAIILIVLVPPIVKSIKAKKQQRLKDEADRKEQERRESMGKWK